MTSSLPESPAGTWLAVTRDDGETVGYLEPLTPDYGRVQPRTRLGHALGGPAGYEDGEERVLGSGLGDLAQPWLLDGAGAPLAIAELSPAGVVLRDALLSKALLPAPEVRVDWPDVAERLRPAPPS